MELRVRKCSGHMALFVLAYEARSMERLGGSDMQWMSCTDAAGHRPGSTTTVHREKEPYGRGSDEDTIGVGADELG